MIFSLAFRLSIEKNTLPSFDNVSSMKSSGIGVVDVDAGVLTSTGSFGLILVAKMKKVSNKNATSHIAVMSTNVLLRGILTLGIISLFYYIDDKFSRFHKISSEIFICGLQRSFEPK